VDPDLAARLTAAGVDPADPGDPAAAWQRLLAAYGPRATLVDRYALEAHARGGAIADLPPRDREEMWREVLAARLPGAELQGDPGGDPVEVVPYDPAWPDAFAAWRDRLAAALGLAAHRIDHVGSTAVPGLAAKPVIDVQVGVAEVTDELAFRPALEGLGLVLRAREPGHRYFRPPRGRPREVQVHVCDAGGRWERAHLLFRDYLRAHRGARETYSALKRALAAEFRHDRWAYNEAKTAFILDSLEAAEVWAAATGWRPGSAG
jgi:GrpB-like predicted nucleotidyltransferase (UPF0157 family)